MKKWLIIVFLLSGCGKELPEANLTIETKDGKFTQIEEKPVDKAEIPSIGGKDKNKIIAIYTIPASTITTTIYVYDDVVKNIGPRRKDEAKKPVTTVTTNPKVIAQYPKVTPWWYWWIGYIVGAGAVYYIGKKYLNIITKPIGWLKKIYELIRK